MEKKAWILLIVVSLLLVLLFMAAADTGFRDGLVAALGGVGGSAWTLIYDGWNGLASSVGASGLYFAIYSIVAVLFGWQLLGRIFKVIKTKVFHKPTTLPTVPIVRQDQLSGASELVYSKSAPPPPEVKEEVKAEA